MHMDNIDRLEKYLLRFKRFVATAQSRPNKKVYNFESLTTEISAFLQSGTWS